MTIYAYLISKEFNTHPNIDQLVNELGALPGFVGLTQKGDEILIELSSVKDGTQLDTIIQSHIPKNKNFTIIPRKNSIQSSVYERLGGSFKYGGSATMGTINYIEIVSYKDDDVTSYSCRIYDSTNNTILAEKTGLTNLEESFIDLGTISNVPIGGALLELHVKRSGGAIDSSVFVEQIIVYYNN